MSKYIDLLNKTDVDNKELFINIEKIAQRMNLKYEKIDDYRADIFKPSESTLEINQMNYEHNKFFKNDLENYSIVITINYYSDGEILLPFLKEFLEIYPDILVFNESGLPKGTEYYVFNKVNFANFNGTDYYALLGNPPQDFGNIT